MTPNTFIDFYGDQTRWFLGTVVDLKDPMELGRVKVDVFGMYDNIKDEDLPWAQIVMPVTEGGTKGFGKNLGIQIGAQVFGMFLDGKNSQLPLVMGSVPKVEGEELSTNDSTRGTNPYDPDLFVGSDEVPVPYGAKYPTNQVSETAGGHLKEYDDTEGAKRIRERHANGTFYQMNDDGDMVTHVVKDRYTVVAGEDKIHVSGNVKVIVGGDVDLSATGTVSINAANIKLNS
jgi:hypothetical protein